MKDLEEIKWLWKSNGGRGIIRLDYNEGLLLAKYASLVTGPIVEIGTRNGGSAYLLAYAAKEENIVTTIDINPIKYSFIKTEFNIDMNSKIKQLKKSLNIVLGDSRKIDVPKEYDLLFIDGRHHINGITNDTNRFWNNCNMYVAYHDYTYARAVTKIVDFLLKNNFCTKLEQQGSMIILKKETNLQNLIAL